MSYLEHIKNNNRYEANRFVPFFVGDELMGWTDRVFAQQLQPYHDVFLIDNESLRFNPEINTPEQRTRALVPVLEQLHREGVIDTWVGETYAVTGVFGEAPRLLMERAAVLYFGVRAYGVHLNGLVKKSDGIYVWIARRTKQKPFWPGMLDQMVAGGQPAGLGLMENVIKESAEEANVPEELSQQARLVSELHYLCDDRRGMHMDTLFNYDLWLPEDFVPENTDDEVDEFMLMPLEQIATITDNSEQFKNNCNLVNIDLLIRLGLINESHPDYDEIRQGLYASATQKIYTS